ncbi:hypothetical protein GOP47_0000449 [Adiantum capillus-veneris]|uniref:OPA3-like protein n=1 Tax=Adiantum capillus-veneris TaxID=13818 RepID=A0A9D4ZT35_ADICA|nr:hypothetical protein GOP47_0000449 [Adiantum capillus-veneris]
MGSVAWEEVRRKGTPLHVPVVHTSLRVHATQILDPEKAVQAAADILGEVIVFSVGVGAVIFEVQRSARSEARKEEARRQEIEAISDRIKSLEEAFDNFLKGQQSSSTWLPFKQAQSQKPEKA